MSSSAAPDDWKEKGERITASNVDLSNCDRELIQYSGAVQPHGALLTFLEPELRIVQVSANTEELFGIAPDDLIGKSLESLFGETQAEQIRQRLSRETLSGVAPVHVLRAVFAAREFHVFAHRTDGVIVLELEIARSEPSVGDLYGHVRGAIARLEATKGLQAFLDLSVDEIRRLTGFDRVMAYEFLPDGSGHVKSESIIDGLEPYLGLHYPASDIPQPARRLFSMMWLRHLPDVDYTPVPLMPAMNPATSAPLDLSYVAGRHVSVMYSKYLQNMGVKATMVLTLLKNGQLWGLISCMNHRSPMHVPYEHRMACEFLAHMVSLLSGAKQDEEVYQQRLHADLVVNQLIGAASRSNSVQDGLTASNVSLLEAVDARGAAIVTGDNVTLLGATPNSGQVRDLAEWLCDQADPVFVTDQLSMAYPAANVFTETGSGLLAARLSRSSCEFVMWFRPEMLATVHWAGNPQKPVEVVTTDADTRLLPRTSFAVWKEEVRGRSAPWRDYEIGAVQTLRQALIEIVLDRATELKQLNRELEKSNIELDAFAYVASHDLKEPLRGIHNYSMLLQRSATGRLTDDERSRLETVMRLTQRMDDLIDGLLQYSRIGRTDLSFQSVDLNEVVRNALDLLRLRIEQSDAEVKVTPLPSVLCDRIRARSVFTNLIQNAIKYNDSERKQVEVGYLDTSPPVFYVRDNGIGIEEEHTEEIFRIFRRLHGRDEYGGGTGAGLTIAKKSVERHGGRMWVSSTPGTGSTFYFTLAAEESERAEATA